MDAEVKGLQKCRPFLLHSFMAKHSSPKNFQESRMYGKHQLRETAAARPVNDTSKLSARQAKLFKQQQKQIDEAFRKKYHPVISGKTPTANTQVRTGTPILPDTTAKNY